MMNFFLHQEASIIMHSFIKVVEASSGHEGREGESESKFGPLWGSWSMGIDVRGQGSPHDEVVIQ
jgi:hypothetical protein